MMRINKIKHFLSHSLSKFFSNKDESLLDPVLERVSK